MIDGFRACPDAGYDDGVVTVRRTPGAGLRWDSGELVHDWGLGDVNNDLAGRLAGTVPPEMFERAFTGVVLTSAPDPLVARRGFYAATLAGLTGTPLPDGSIAEFAPIYVRAASLVRGSRVLDLASCFGFLPILLHRNVYDVMASDVNVASMALLARVEPALPVLVCGAEAVPLPDRSVDTVLALHLLEHVPVGVGAAILAEACRVAGQRVVVAFRTRTNRIRRTAASAPSPTPTWWRTAPPAGGPTTSSTPTAAG